jgi:hypothetical protein
MASVNQTRPHCVDQMGKTHSKPLAARYGRGTAWARRAVCESAFSWADGIPSSHCTGVSVCLRNSLNGIEKSLLVLAGNRDTIPRSSRLWPSHCTKHSNTPSPTSFQSCDNFSREKDREGRLANSAPLRAVVVIPLTLRGWNGKLRFVRILSQSTKVLR